TLIDFLGEKQGDIDVNAFADQLLKRGNALGGARNLDHDVWSGNGTPEAACFFESAPRVAGAIGRNLQANIASVAIGVGIDRAEHGGGSLDIADGKQFGTGFGVEIGPLGERCQEVGVIGAAGNRLFKDGGV